MRKYLTNYYTNLYNYYTNHKLLNIHKLNNIEIKRLGFLFHFKKFQSVEIKLLYLHEIVI